MTPGTVYREHSHIRGVSGQRDWSSLAQGRHTRKIFVAGLNLETNETTLEKLFNKYGKIVEVLLMKDKITARSRGFGFITFENPRDAEVAVKEMNGQDVAGKVIKVDRATKPAHAPGEKGPSRGPPGRGPPSRGPPGRGPPLRGPPGRGPPPSRGGRGGKGARDSRGGRGGGPPSRGRGGMSRGGRGGSRLDRGGRSDYGGADYNGSRSGGYDRLDGGFGAGRGGRGAKRGPPDRMGGPPPKSGRFDSDRGPPPSRGPPPLSRGPDRGPPPTSRGPPPRSSYDDYPSRDYPPPRDSRDYDRDFLRDPPVRERLPPQRDYPPLRERGPSRADYGPPREREVPPRDSGYGGRDYGSTRDTYGASRAPEYGGRDSYSTARDSYSSASRDYPPRDYGPPSSGRDYPPTTGRDYGDSGRGYSSRESYAGGRDYPPPEREPGYGRDSYSDSYPDSARYDSYSGGSICESLASVHGVQAAHADHPLVPHRQAIQAAVPADTGIVTIHTGVPAPPALDTKSAAVPVDQSGQEDEMRIHRATEAAGADGQNVAVTGVVAGAVAEVLMISGNCNLF
ncbi:hypothetical protein Bbelb_234560 [Branchiostoma belcheri]|nr:hypothetical protein Bbelb_234560 [Branchiostoma belcheri]